MSAADPVVATWVQATGCGTRYEELTADGQVHVDYAPPFGESYSEDDDDNPICHCPRLPQQFCMECAGCAACGQCSGPHVWPLPRDWG